MRLNRLQDIEQNGLHLGAVSIPIANTSSLLGIWLNQAWRGKRLVDVVGSNWSERRSGEVGSADNSLVRAFVEDVQGLIRRLSGQTILEIFDPAMIIGYLLLCYIRFRLDDDEDAAAA